MGEVIEPQNSALRRHKQKDLKSKVSLSYTAKSCQDKNKTKVPIEYSPCQILLRQPCRRDLMGVAADMFSRHFLIWKGVSSQSLNYREKKIAGN